MALITLRSTLGVDGEEEVGQMESLDDVLIDTVEKMDNTLKMVKDQFAATLRTGKASPALVDGVQVTYYGTDRAARSGEHFYAGAQVDRD